MENPGDTIEPLAAITFPRMLPSPFNVFPAPSVSVPSLRPETSSVALLAKISCELLGNAPEMPNASVP